MTRVSYYCHLSLLLVTREIYTRHLCVLLVTCIFYSRHHCDLIVTGFCTLVDISEENLVTRILAITNEGLQPSLICFSNVVARSTLAFLHTSFILRHESGTMHHKIFPLNTTHRGGRLEGPSWPMAFNSLTQLLLAFSIARVPDLSIITGSSTTDH